jgi:trehalose 6-phosphate synthase/phosphatase
MPSTLCEPAAPNSRVVVVSNRLPLTLRLVGNAWRTERSSGGLAAAVGPFLRRTGGVWIGWPGDPADHTGRAAQLALWRERYGYLAVDLPNDIALAFYEGYANQTLWPLFHQFSESLEFDQTGWDAYGHANRLFREAVLAELKPDDLVWIHDYHLMLLPQLLREARPHARIGFFLHIPFPSSDVFRALPRREELLRGLLGADLLGFQTHGDLQNFRSSLLRVLGIDSRMDQVEIGGEVTRLEALPIGIEPEEFAGFLERNTQTQRALAKHRRRFEGQRVLLAVDRLDYTKGIPQRLRTFRRLLVRAPDLRGTIVLVQLAVPSRERIPRYADLRHEVSELVGEINGDFGTPEWTPVVYMRRGISRADLAALYAVSDVGWITPLRDGMNLVAKEYVACQRGRPGALVLSEFAGAAAEMGEAFLVNPYDEDRTADVIEKVLGLPAAERALRMDALHRRVQRNNVFAWGERFLRDLGRAARRPAVGPSDTGRPLPLARVLESFARAETRLLLLDYDGTLVPFSKTPWEAAPPPEVIDLLTPLSRDPTARVVVISGRSRDDLDAWFGRVPRLWLAAEHGVMLRSPDTQTWTLARRPPSADLWERVRPVLEHFADRTPGSLIEDKEYSLVWHYRMSDPEFGEWLANELVATLDGMLAETELRAVRGHKSVEVRPIWASKGEVLHLLDEVPPAEGFCLAVGDDRTDEDLFEQLPPRAWTIRVGVEPSRARFRLPDPSSVLTLLHRLARLAERREAGSLGSGLDGEDSGWLAQSIAAGVHDRIP